MIRFDELNDVTITIALTELKSVADNNKVCDQSLRKILGSELKNMDYLYEVISEDE